MTHGTSEQSPSPVGVVGASAGGVEALCSFECGTVLVATPDHHQSALRAADRSSTSTADRCPFCCGPWVSAILPSTIFRADAGGHDLTAARFEESARETLRAAELVRRLIDDLGSSAPREGAG